jgi:hypothetical protein
MYISTVASDHNKVEWATKYFVAKRHFARQQTDGRRLGLSSVTFG